MDSFTAIVSFNPQSLSRNMTIPLRLLQRDFWGKSIRAELLAPGAPARSLAVKPFGRDTRIVAPELHTWAILRFVTQ